MSKIFVVNVSALSYSGTTWLNLLLGSHPDTCTIGPPARLWSLRDEQLESACRVHDKDCNFWPAFGKQWDQRENLFVALNKFSGKSIFLMDGAPPAFVDEVLSHKDVQLLNARYLRDGRAITASYARKMQKSGVNYLDSILPDAWFYHSFQAIPSVAELKAQKQFVARYEDASSNQAAFLRAAGLFLGIEYPQDAIRFWEKDHHITSGNQGPITMVRLHQGLAAKNFESAETYRTQLERLRENPQNPFVDERWKTQLERQDLFWFDLLMGEKNAELGYERDVFSAAEIAEFAHDGLENREFASKLPKSVLETAQRLRRG